MARGNAALRKASAQLAGGEVEPMPALTEASREVLMAQLKAEREAAAAPEMDALRGVESIDEQARRRIAEMTAAGLSEAERSAVLMAEILDGAVIGVAPAAVRAAVLVPLSELKRDPENVRRGTKGDLEQLAADLLAHGQLQNLVVRGDGEEFANGGYPGGYFVEAGDRRLRALQLLAKRGDIAKDYPVSVIVLGPGEAAREAGLAENFQRLAMGPADEARAFAEAVTAASDPATGEAAAIEGVARRFGVTVRHVRQRLRLAGLHPVVLDALAKNKITLDVAQAFASVPDAERQAKVFKDAGKYDLSNATSIRRLMQRVGYPADHPRALFVGRADYVAAGGSFAVDLFAEGDAEHWLDDAIVDRLAGQKLADEAAKLRARFGFDRVIPFMTHGDDAATEGLALHGTWTDWTQVPEGVRSQLVVLCDISHDGEAEISANRAWLCRGDMAVVEREAPPPSAMTPDPVVVVSEEEPAPSSMAPAEREAKDIPQSLKDALAMRRRDVLAFELTCDGPGSTAVAHDLAAFLMVDQAGKRFPDLSLGSALTVHELNDPVKGDLPWADDGLAEALGHAWNGGDAPMDETWRTLDAPADRFAAFRALPLVDRARWMARGVAATLRAVQLRGYSNEPQAVALQAEIAAQLGGIDVAQHWRPTANNYFDRAGKAACMAFLAHCLDKPVDQLAAWAKWKKAELSGACEALAAGNAAKLGGLGNTDQAAAEARGARWVPVEMMFGGGK